MKKIRKLKSIFLYSPFGTFFIPVFWIFSLNLLIILLIPNHRVNKDQEYVKYFKLEEVKNFPNYKLPQHAIKYPNNKQLKVTFIYNEVLDKPVFGLLCTRDTLYTDTVCQITLIKEYTEIPNHDPNIFRIEDNGSTQMLYLNRKNF